MDEAVLVQAVSRIDEIVASVKDFLTGHPMSEAVDMIQIPLAEIEAEIGIVNEIRERQIEAYLNREERRQISLFEEQS